VPVSDTLPTNLL